MVHLHAVRKLLDTSGISNNMLVTQKTEGQWMHDWYVTFTGSGFRGRMVMLYFHDPSMMMVATPGKSIHTTFPLFRERLERLLRRSEFPTDVIQREISLAEDFAAGKTSSRSMLGNMNQPIETVEWDLRKFDSFEDIDYDMLEDIQMNHLVVYDKRKYRRPLDYWESTLGCTLVNRYRRS